MIPSDLVHENNSYGSVLVSSPRASDHLVIHQIQFMIRHRPDWLVPCYVRYRSGKPQVCLDISNLRSLDEAFATQKQNPEKGRRILCEICEKLRHAADYLLPEIQFSLNASLIFLDQNDNIQLTFWPFMEHVEIDDPSSLCSFLTQSRETPELIRSFGKAYQWLPNDTQHFISVYEEQGLPGLISELRNRPENSEKSSKKFKSTYNRKQKQDRSYTFRNNKHKIINKRSLNLVFFWSLHVAAGILAVVNTLNKHELTQTALLILSIALIGMDLVLLLRVIHWDRILEKTHNLIQFLSSRLIKGNQDSPQDEDQTVLLPSDSTDFSMAMLSEGCPGTPEEHEGLRAFVLVDEFIVGRDSKKADLCLPDTTVGRVHARIIRRSGSFFIQDCGSGNGTFIDDKRVPKHAEQLLPDQCRLRFAGRVFYFQAD